MKANENEPTSHFRQVDLVARWIGWVNSQIGLPVIDANTNIGMNKGWIGLGGHRLAGWIGLANKGWTGLGSPSVWIDSGGWGEGDGGSDWRSLAIY